MILGHSELLLSDGYHQFLLGLYALSAISHHAIANIWLDLAQRSTECHLMLSLLCLLVELAEDGVLSDVFRRSQALTQV